MVDVSGAVDAEAGSRLRMYSVADLRPHPRNVKKHPERQLRLLADEIKRDGFNAPIAVWRDTFVIAGEGRLEAAKRAGLTEIPGIDCNHLDEAGARRFMLADNRLSDLAEYDADGLRAELASLAEFDDMDLDAIGFGLDDLDAILPPLEPEPAPPAPPAPKREASPKAPSPKPPAVKTEPTETASTEPQTPPAQSGESASPSASTATEPSSYGADVATEVATAPSQTITAAPGSTPISKRGEVWRLSPGLELNIAETGLSFDLVLADKILRMVMAETNEEPFKPGTGEQASIVQYTRRYDQPHAAGEGASAEN
jgi:hypothetical protein